MKKILVVCGTGTATSTVANRMISEYLNAKGIKVSVTQAKVTEIAAYAGEIDLLVLMATGAAVPSNINVPVIKGLSFLTGIGKEEVLKEIEEIVK
ncbi:PTS system galactitol-specific EIIB component [Sporomusa rhizae]|uniref:PTS sugar transporter subunit IIB n=1 Tax=Sporomusa rhizae TaxID=357999 RepID=UPI00352B4AAE